MTYPSLVRAPADAVFGTNERPKATGGKSYFHVMHDAESSDIEYSAGSSRRDRGGSFAERRKAGKVAGRNEVKSACPSGLSPQATGGKSYFHVMHDAESSDKLSNVEQRNKIKDMKVAVVGATGLVGTRMLEVLAERNFPVTELLPVASAKSVGRKITFQGKEWTVVSAEDAIAARPDLALFSAGGGTSAELAPKFAAVGTRVVDNSSQWRMDPTKKLVVPEINGDVLEESDYIIANPNCSTIQMLLPLWPLHKAYTIKRIVVSTYQSVTGTGYKAMDQMTAERAGGKWGEYPAVYPHPIDQNILPHIDSFLETGYTKEEMKMVNETHKIFGDDSIGVSPTTVRVPVQGGHSESINLEFEKEFTLEDVRRMMEEAPGVTLQDDPANNVYPMPLYAWGKNDVFVGRIRRDPSVKSGLNFWCVADNLRKGAATNAVQIAEKLIEKGFLPRA